MDYYITVKNILLYCVTDIFIEEWLITVLKYMCYKKVLPSIYLAKSKGTAF